MTDKDEDQELAMIAARAAEIKAGLDASYSTEELKRPLSTRVVHSLVAGAVAAVFAKFNALSARVETLEEGGIRYVGNYQRAAAYARGDTVTHSGSLWVALKAVPEGTAPGSDTSFWQLSAKGSRPIARTRKEPEEKR